MRSTQYLDILEDLGNISIYLENMVIQIYPIKPQSYDAYCSDTSTETPVLNLYTLIVQMCIYI